jgi:uncharacterized protein
VPKGRKNMKKLLLLAACCCFTPAYAVQASPCVILEKTSGQLTAEQLQRVVSRASSQSESDVSVLALLHLCGVGVPKDTKHGLSLLTSAAEAGDVQSIQVLAGIYGGEFGDAPNMEKFKEWLILGADKGSPDMQFALAGLYLNGTMVPKNADEAEKWFLKSAAQGNGNAQAALGEFYADRKRYVEALPWLNLSAALGVANAQFSLGNLYYFGLGVEASPVVAMKWWRLAADQKYAKSQFNVGTAYQSGRGVERNQTEAIRWYRLAAEQGLPQGMEAMARLYEFGIGVQQDRAMAFEWWKKLAEDKNPPAQIRVGWMYLGGVGVAKNAVEGVKWFRTAAEQGMPEAYVSLALAYEYGLGVPVDLEIAHELRLKKRNRPYASELIDSCAFISDGQLDEQDARDFRWKLHFWTPEAFARKAESYLAAHKPNDALCWYQRAADSAFLNGLTSLGSAYLGNGEIPTNSKLGIHYLRVGAAQGSVPARVRLAQAFQAGEFVPKNMIAAYALRFSTKRDLEELDSVLEGYHSSIEDDMTPDQISRAKQLIREMLAPGQYLIALDRFTTP